MQKLDLKTVGKLKPHPLFKGLPEELKDPKCFNKIEKKLSGFLKADHVHKNVKEFVTCAWCQEGMKKRQQAMKDYGFKNIQQYFEWKKIMSIIKSKKDFKLN